MTEDDLRTALLPAMPAGVDIIIAHENGPRPAGLYVTLRIENTHQLPGHAGPLEGNPAPTGFGTMPIDAHRTGLLELQCFGVGSFEVLDLAMQRLQFETVIEAAEALNIAFGRSSDVENVPALRNELSFEPRAIVSLPFAYTRRVVESLPYIETVEGTISIEGEIAGTLPPMPYTATIVDN